MNRLRYLAIGTMLIVALTVPAQRPDVRDHVVEEPEDDEVEHRRAGSEAEEAAGVASHAASEGVRPNFSKAYRCCEYSRQLTCVTISWRHSSKVRPNQSRIRNWM